MRAFLAEHQEAGAQDALEAAISAAILEQNTDQGLCSADEPGFSCESHVILLKSSAGRAGGPVDTVTVYLMALYQVYSFPGGVIQEVGGSHIPAALTFAADGAGGCRLVEYWMPRDGSYYVPDLRKRFPAEIAEDALDTQKYILSQKQDCYAQAVESGRVDTDTAIKGLMDIILSSPAASSAPMDHIEAHPVEYWELAYYGDSTLEYCFGEFLKGGQTDLRGGIFQAVMDRLLEEERISGETASGQVYFDAWRAETEKAYMEHGEAYMRT